MNTRLLLFLACFPIPATSHDLWIERSGTLHQLAYGHAHSGHEGTKQLEYKPEAVKNALCFKPSGDVAIRIESGFTYPATLSGDCAVSRFSLSTGYWSKTPYGTKNLPKGEAGAVIDSWLSVESVERIDHWGDGLARPLTHELELTPLNNPLALKAGDKLRLRVFYQGKPAANVTVAYFGKPRGVTGADGAMNIRLSAPGFQLIQASLELPLSDGMADKAIHSASLQFDLP